MSEHTKRVLDAALAAHVADTVKGTVVTGYLIVAAAQGAGDMGRRCLYPVIFQDGQPYHVTLGLAAMVDDVVDTQYADAGA